MRLQGKMQGKILNLQKATVPINENNQKDGGLEE